MWQRPWRSCDVRPKLSQLGSTNSSEEILHHPLQLGHQGPQRTQLVVLDVPTLTHGYSLEPLGQSDCLWALSGNNTRGVWRGHSP
jgi:hypothetical protein